MSSVVQPHSQQPLPQTPVIAVPKSVATPQQPTSPNPTRPQGAPGSTVSMPMPSLHTPSASVASVSTANTAVMRGSATGGSGEVHSYYSMPSVGASPSAPAPGGSGRFPPTAMPPLALRRDGPSGGAGTPGGSSSGAGTATPSGAATGRAPASSGARAPSVATGSNTARASSVPPALSVARNGPTSPATAALTIPLFEGFLEKKLTLRWVRRFFALVGTTLTYKDTQQSPSAEARKIQLARAQITFESADFAMHITGVGLCVEKPNRADFTLRAPNAAVFDALRSAVQHATAGQQPRIGSVSLTAAFEQLVAHWQRDVMDRVMETTVSLLLDPRVTMGELHVRRELSQRRARSGNGPWDQQQADDGQLTGRSDDGKRGGGVCMGLRRSRRQEQAAAAAAAAAAEASYPVTPERKWQQGPSDPTLDQPARALDKLHFIIENLGSLVLSHLGRGGANVSLCESLFTLYSTKRPAGDFVLTALKFQELLDAVADQLNLSLLGLFRDAVRVALLAVPSMTPDAIDDIAERAMNALLDVAPGSEGEMAPAVALGLGIDRVRKRAVPRIVRRLCTTAPNGQQVRPRDVTATCTIDRTQFVAHYSRFTLLPLHVVGTVRFSYAASIVVDSVRDVTPEGACHSPRAAPTRAEDAGISNIGNTCYANAVLQCLCHVLRLRVHLDAYERLDEGNATVGSEKLKPNGVTRSLTRLSSLTAEATPEATAITGARPALIAAAEGGRLVAAILKAVNARTRNAFADLQQQDAHEFLVAIMDAVLAETKRPRVVLYRPLPDRATPGLDITAVAREWWAAHVSRNDSFVTRLFHGQTKSEVRCGKCGTAVSLCFDPFSCLHLSFPDDAHRHSQVPLSACLDNMFRLSALGAETVACPTCGTRQPAQQHQSIMRLPPVLFVVLKRFDRNEANPNVVRKVSHNVRVPLVLDMAPWCDRATLLADAKAAVERTHPSQQSAGGAPASPSPMRAPIPSYRCGFGAPDPADLVDGLLATGTRADVAGAPTASPQRVRSSRCAHAVSAAWGEPDPYSDADRSERDDEDDYGSRSGDRNSTASDGGRGQSRGGGGATCWAVGAQCAPGSPAGGPGRGGNNVGAGCIGGGNGRQGALSAFFFNRGGNGDGQQLVVEGDTPCETLDAEAAAADEEAVDRAARVASAAAASVRYRLSGVISHAGRGVDHGHYVALCISRHTKKWTYYDDSTVATHPRMQTAQDAASAFEGRLHESVRAFWAQYFGNKLSQERAEQYELFMRRQQQQQVYYDANAGCFANSGAPNQFGSSHGAAGGVASSGAPATPRSSAGSAFTTHALPRLMDANELPLEAQVYGDEPYVLCFERNAEV